MTTLRAGRPRLDPGALPDHGTLWVAYSGGADSTCLLHRLIVAGFGRRVHALHVDHRMDPESGARAERAAHQAEAMGVPFDALTLDPARYHRGIGPEAAAREARYAALAGRIEPGDTILTAHHADDRIETLLQMLLRGAGPRGLAGMPVRRPFGRGWLGRPLLRWTRAELRAELEDAAIDWVHDVTNDRDSSDRNWLRHRVLPKIEARWPDYRTSMLHSLRWLDHAAEAVERDAERDLQRLLCSADRSSDGRIGAEKVLDRPAWLALPEARAFEALRRWIGESEAAGAASLQEFHRQCRDAAPDRTPCLSIDDLRIHSWRNALWRDRGAPLPPDWAVEPEGSKVDLPHGLGRVEWRGIAGRVTIGALQPGERLRDHAGGPRRKAAELLREAGLPPWRRQRVPALRVDGVLRALGSRWRDPEIGHADLTWRDVPDDLLPYVSVPSAQPMVR